MVAVPYALGQTVGVVLEAGAYPAEDMNLRAIRPHRLPRLSSGAAIRLCPLIERVRLG
jgi:hypothetical protein